MLSSGKVVLLFLQNNCLKALKIENLNNLSLLIAHVSVLLINDFKSYIFKCCMIYKKKEK